MTNYSDIPMSSFVCQDVKQYTFNDDKPKDFDGILTKIVIDLLKQYGFNRYDDACVPILKQCLNDFYRDLIERFKQHLELVDSSRNFQDAFERTLEDVMSENLHDLYSFIQ